MPWTGQKHSLVKKNLYTVMLRDETATLIGVTELKAVKCEARLSTIDKTWSGMLDLLALSSVLQCRIYSVYPDCNWGIRPLLSGVINPVGTFESDVVLPVMWTRDGFLDNTQSYPFEPNHFVPVLRKWVETDPYKEENHHKRKAEEKEEEWKPCEKENHHKRKSEQECEPPGEESEPHTEENFRKRKPEEEEDLPELPQCQGGCAVNTWLQSSRINYNP